MILSEFEFLFNNNDFQGTVKKNESLSKHTTICAGGKANFFVEPENTESLVYAVKKFHELKLNFFVLGGGSNVIFSEKGTDIVLSTRKLSGIDLIKTPEAGNFILSVQAGTSWGKILDFCKKNNLGGLERFSGLSGTAGGAVFMNATCFSLSVSDVLKEVCYLEIPSLCKKNYSFCSSDWSYKKSFFNTKNTGALRGENQAEFPAEGVAANKVDAQGETSPSKIILSGNFNVVSGFNEKEAQETLEKRKSMGHFRSPSAGSAFKNIPEKNLIAGKLIDECGLKGFSIGGAQIAPWHGNFFINPQNKANGSDFFMLRDFVIKTVKEKTGIILEPEIIYI